MPIATIAKPAVFLGTMKLGEHPMLVFEFKTPIPDPENGYTLRYALAYHDNYPDFEGTEEETFHQVQYRGPVAKKPLNESYCIVELIEEIKHEPSSKLESSYEVQVVSKSVKPSPLSSPAADKTIQITCPEDVRDKFLNLCEELSGQFTKGDRRWKTLQKLMDFHTGSVPF